MGYHLVLIPFLGGWTSMYHKSQLFWCELQGYYWFWHTAIWMMIWIWIFTSKTGASNIEQTKTWDVSIWFLCKKCGQLNQQSHDEWIGLRENLNRKPSIFPLNQSMAKATTSGWSNAKNAGVWELPCCSPWRSTRCADGKMAAMFNCYPDKNHHVHHVTHGNQLS